jgi:hypothetical protein
MSQENIDTESLPSGGDPLRTSFDNSNLRNLFTLPISNSEAINGTLVEVVNTTQPAGNINNIGNVYITNKFDSRANNPVLIRQKAKVSKPILAQASTFTEVESLETNTSTITVGPYRNQEYINIGASPNDGNGDPLRTAFSKINNNFSNLFLTTTTTSTAYTLGNAQGQVIFEVPVVEFYQGDFQIRSSDSGTPDMQNITLTASITNNLAGVRFTGHSTLFRGNAICRYNMDVSAGNVRILINPLADIGIEHFIAAYITYPDQVVISGIEIALDGYANGYLLGTENNLILTTESE